VSAPLLTVPQLAERLGVRPRFIYRLVDERRIPFIHVGRYLRFDPADVDEYLAGRRTAAADS
jgi:excisionase family DNA binding protein